MANKRKLEVVILGDNKLSPAFRGASKDAKRFGNDMHVLGRISSKTGASLGLLAKGVAGVGVAMTGGLVFGLKKSIDAFGESQAVAKQTTTVLKSTGDAANVTAKQVAALATSISKKSGMDDEAVQSGENLLLTFTRIRNESGKGNKIFDRTTRAAADLSAAMTAAGKNMSMSDAALQLGKALNDPAAGMSRLQRIGVTFTDEQKKQATALQKSGDMMGAQKIILKELHKEFGGSAKAAGSTFRGSINKLKTSLGNLGEVIGGAVAPALQSAVDWTRKLVDRTIDGEGPVAAAFDHIKDAARGVRDGIKVAKDAISGLFDKFKEAKGDKAPDLGRMLGVGELTKKRSTIGALGKVFGDAFKSVDWKGIGATIATGLGSAMDFTGKLPALISQGLSAAFGQVNGEQVLGKLVDVLGQAVEALFSPSFWIKHFAAIFSVVTLVIPLAKILRIPGARPLFNFISKPVFKAIGFLGKGAASLLGKVGVGAMKGLWTGLSREFPRITGFIGKIAGKAASALSGLPGKLKGIAGRAGGAVASALANAVGRVGEAAGHLAGQAIKAIGRIVGGLASAGGRAVKALAKRLIPGAVVKAVANIGAKAVEVLHNLGARFLELGKNLIQGMVNGIKSKAADVANAATDVAKGAVSGVKGFLRIKSPSKVFEEIGKNVIAGFVGGILSKREQVAAGLKSGLLFPIDAAIAALEKKKEKLQATWDKIDTKAEKSALIRALTKAKNAPIKFTVSSDGGSSGGGSRSGGWRGKAVIAGGRFAQGMGLDVGESKYFGGVTTNRHAHYKNDHYSGNSIDINAAGGGAGETTKLRAALKALRAKFGSLIQQAMIEDAGAANQHLHVTFKNAIAGTKAATSGAAKSAGGKWGKIIAAASKRFGIPAAILRGLIKVESGGNINAVSSAGAFGLTQFMPATARAYGVKRGDANSQIMGAAKYLRALGFSKNAVKALNAYNGAQTIGGKVNPYAGKVIGAAQSVSGAFGFGKVTTNAKERAGNIRDAVKSLREFNTQAKRAKILAKIDARITGLERLKAFKDAIKGIRDQVKDLAAQAAAAWRGAEEARINAAHEAAIKAVAESADSIELASLLKQDADEADAKEKQGLDDAKTDADKAVADAYAQLQQDGSAAYKAEWQAAYDAALKAQKDAADAIETYNRGKRETELQAAIDAATTAADTTQQTALDGLDQQEQDYADSLERQFDALTANLEKRKTTYAQWAKSVNDILNVYGLGVEVDPDTEAAVVAGPGGAPVWTGTHGAFPFGPGGSGPNPPVGKGPNGKYSWHDGKGYVHSKPKKKRALGGPVMAGESYLVGERGPELLTMGGGGNGHITPNNRLPRDGGRGGDVYLTRNGNVTIGSTKAARVMANKIAYRAAFGN